MSQQEILCDYGAINRNYCIADEGANLRDLVTIDLGWLRQFVTTLEELILAREKQDIAEIESKIPAPVNWAEHYPWQWQDIIGTQLRQSYIVALMSVIERHLEYTVAEVGAVLSQEPPSLMTMKMYEFMKNARKFLLDTAGFSKPANGAWNLVDNLRELRNGLVHCSGFLDGNRRAEKIRQFIEQTPELELESGFVQITPVFCQSVQKSIEDFFADLHQQHVALCRRLASVQ